MRLILALMVSMGLALPALAQQIDLKQIGGVGTGASVGPSLTNRVTDSGVTFNLKDDFGAACDGVTDDTTAIQAWLNKAAANVRLVAPAGTCVFTSALTTGAASYYTIGAAGDATILLYKGASTTVDLLTINSPDATPPSNLTIGNFLIRSNTVMTGGFALKVNGAAASRFENITLDGSRTGNGNLCGGAWFNGAAGIVLQSPNLRSFQNCGPGVAVNDNLGGSADLVISNGFIGGHNTAGVVAGFSVGVLEGGGFGGIICSHTDVHNNIIGGQIDNSLVAEPNREFDAICDFDGNQNAAFYVNDTLASKSSLRMSDWVASTQTGPGLWIHSWPFGVVEYNGHKIYNNCGDGVLIDDPTTIVLIGSAVAINSNGAALNTPCTTWQASHTNAGFGIAASVPTSNVYNTASRLFQLAPGVGTNVKGFANGNVNFNSALVTTGVYASAYAANVVALGSGYVPGDTWTPTISGGNTVVPVGNLQSWLQTPVFTIVHTQVASASIVGAGTGCTPGPVTLTGTTGVTGGGASGRFTAQATANGSGNLTGSVTITYPSNYLTNPTLLTAEPVTGGSCTGATLSIAMGVYDLKVQQPGTFFSIPAGNFLGTQSATSGTGTGATATVYFAPASTDRLSWDFTNNWHNEGLGYQALANVTTGSENTAFGVEAGWQTTAGKFQTYVGTGAGARCTVTTSATAVGVDAMRCDNANTNNTGTFGNYSVAVGADALRGTSDSTGLGEVALGYEAVGGVPGTVITGNYDTAVGYEAGMNLTSGGRNLLLGAFVAPSLTTGAFNVLLGTANSCDVPTAGTSNYFALCASSGATPLLSGSLDTTALSLKVNGPLTLAGPYSAAGTAIPACSGGTTGAVASVSDATSQNGKYISGGSFEAPVFCNGSQWNVVSAVNQPGPVIIGTGTLPFIVPPTGSMANNGAYTTVNTIDNAYPNSYTYFAINQIASGVAAGWYYATWSDGGTATIYNNTYTAGTPTIPASPTAFVTTGPGAITGVTGATAAYSLTIPGSTVGLNDCVRATALATFPSTNTKSFSASYGAFQLGATNQTTNKQYATTWGFCNRQTASVQTKLFNDVGGNGASANAVTYGSVNSTTQQSLFYNIAHTTATDYVVLQSVVVELLRGAQ